MSDISNLSLSSADEDEERIPRRRRALRDRINPFDLFDEQEFKMRFRFEKQTILWLCDLIGPEIEPIIRRRKPVTALNQILLTMRYLATGGFQQLLGDTFAAFHSMCYYYPTCGP
jgi:hypothetical protein